MTIDLNGMEGGKMDIIFVKLDMDGWMDTDMQCSPLSLDLMDTHLQLTDTQNQSTSKTTNTWLLKPG